MTTYKRIVVRRMNNNQINIYDLYHNPLLSKS